MKKRKMLLTLPILSSLLLGNPVSADEKPAVVFVNYDLVKFPDQEPVIKYNRTLVPLRGVFEKMGAKVNWDQKTNVVTAILHDRTIKLKIGDKKATMNGVNWNLDVPAITMNNRTMVPLRFIAESFGGEVDWIPEHEFNNVISIEGQYKKPYKEIKVASNNIDGGNSELDYDVTATSFPIVIKTEKLEITIHNLYKSEPYYRNPVTSKIVGNDMYSGTDEPVIDNSIKHVSGIVRVNATIKNLSSEPFTVDNKSNVIFENTSYSDQNSTWITQQTLLNKKGITHTTDTFKDFMGRKVLSQGQSTSGVIPLPSLLSKTKPETYLQVWVDKKNHKKVVVKLAE